MDYGHWKVWGEFDIDDFFGFVYRIVDKRNGKEYLGKKQFFSTTRKPPLKGKKRRRVCRKQSDWKTYTGSSKYLNEEIAQAGKENFEFYILSLHTSKASLHYTEIETQILEDVLRAKLPNGEPKYYNRAIAHIKFIPPPEVSDETRHKIRETLLIFWSNTDHHYYNSMSDEEKADFDRANRIGLNNSTEKGKTPEEVREWVETHLYGSNNPMFGRCGVYSPRFGSDPWANLSEERKNEIRKHMSQRMAGDKNPRFGKSPFEYFTSEELYTHKLKLSQAMSGEGNPMHGVNQWEHKPEKAKTEWREKISASTRGKPKSDETKARISESKKGKSLPKTTCPHCGKEGSGPNMTRYHFDKCQKNS
jgi:hypothetical protein